MNRSRHEVVLCIFIFFELLFFASTGHNFLSIYNGFECIRLGVEIGLLALALTPVIVTGGIDLSVGSMMGLAAVIFGFSVARVPLGHHRGNSGSAAGEPAGWTPECLAHFHLASFTAHRYVGHLLAVSRHRRRHHRRRCQLLQLSGVFSVLGSGLLVRHHPSSKPAVAGRGSRLLGIAGTGRSIGRVLYAVGYSYEGARYAGVPVRRRVRAGLPAVWTRRRCGRYYLCRASGPGKIGRRQRL